MRIVIASHEFSPDIGGLATTEAGLAKAFADAGDDVTVLTLTRGGSDEGGFNVIRRPSMGQMLSCYRAADIVILSNLSLKIGLPLLFLKREFALRHHSESAFSLSSFPFSRDALRRMLRDRAKHFVTSEYVGRRSGLRKFSVTHPSPDLQNLTPEMKRPLEERAGLLYVGRLEPEKGVRFLMSEWPRMRSALGVSRLRVVGDGSLRSEVEQWANRERDGGVEFLGRKGRSGVFSEMGHSAFVVVPSEWQEPFGAVALEALAAGAVLISTDRGGLCEAGGSLGFYYSPGDDASFAKCLAAARSLWARRSASSEVEAVYQESVSKHLESFEAPRIVEIIKREMVGEIHWRA